LIHDLKCKRPKEAKIVAAEEKEIATFKRLVTEKGLS
jgi:hypothetical protein